MRTLHGVHAQLVEDLKDLANHIRLNYAWGRMTVEECEASLETYTKLVDIVAELEGWEVTD